MFVCVRVCVCMCVRVCARTHVGVRAAPRSVCIHRWPIDALWPVCCHQQCAICVLVSLRVRSPGPQHDPASSPVWSAA